MNALQLFDKLMGLNIRLHEAEGNLRIEADKGAMSEALIEQIKEHKTGLLELLARQSTSDGKLADGVVTLDAPLSFAQNRLWFLDRLTEGGSQYNIASRYMFRGDFDVEALRRAVSEVIERHKVLRTVYLAQDGAPYLGLKSDYELPFTYVDVSTQSDTEKQRSVQELMAEEQDTGFDLSEQLMIRVQVIKLSQERNLMLYTMHHIASDGWSLTIFRNELLALYEAYRNGKPSSLAPLLVQYSDYASWQREWLQGDVLDQQLQYWSEQLKGIPAVHAFPLDRPRPSQQLFSGQMQRHTLDSNSTARVRDACEQHGVTLFMFMHSSMSILLHRYSGETDIVIGAPIAGRTHRDVEGLIGFFVNMLVLRADLSNDPSIEDFLQNNKQTILDSYAHQHLPFEMLVEQVAPDRNLSFNPLVQISLAVQNSDKETEKATTSSAAPAQDGGSQLSEVKTNRFDLDLYVNETDDGLVLNWQFSDALFFPETVARLADSFHVLIDGLARALTVEAKQGARVSELPMLTATQSEELINRATGSRTKLDLNVFAHKKFELHANSEPQRAAVCASGDKIDYGTLNKRADDLAVLLQSHGVGPGVLVGLFLEPSIDMIVATLGILKAGGAYVPIDPAYPEQRVSYILADADVRCVVTVTAHAQALSDSGKVLVTLDHDQASSNGCSMAEPDSKQLVAQHLLPKDLAYVIYTSGSTGQPKGVMVEHQQLAASTAARTQYYGPAGQCLLVSSVAFDSSVASIFATLTSGGCLHLIAASLLTDAKYLRSIIATENIAEILCVPSFFERIAQLEISSDAQSLNWAQSLTRVVMAGEECPPGLVHAWQKRFPAVAMYNEYGPTEATVWSTVFRCSPLFEGTRIPIGQPIPNSQTYVLDDHGAPVPVGAFGELCIGGAGVARGYLRRPALTAARFTVNPFAPAGGERMYRTSDRVRWLESGELEFRGRMDEQLKIRGYRIEPGEIEACLLEIDGLTEAAVIGVPSAESSSGTLAAYLVTELQVDSRVDREEFVQRTREYLSSRLPHYMIPDIYVHLEAIPRSPNGKVDLRALPKPTRTDLQSTEFTAPRNALEESMCQIWRDLLKVNEVGIHDNFFLMGGHSLLAMRLMSAIQRQLNVDIPLRTFFECPTVASLADNIADHNHVDLLPPIVRISRDQDLALSFSQQRLWFVNQMIGPNTIYNMPIASELKGDVDVESLKRSLLEICSRHESLRTRFVEREHGADQVIDPPPERFEIDVVSDGKALRDICRGERNYVFDLAADKLCRIRIVLNQSNKRYSLLVNMHHAISDGWSWGIFFSELRDLYDAFKAGKDSPLPPLELQYVDYAHWQHQWLQGTELESELQYWRSQLADLPLLLTLPTDYPRPEEKGFSGDELSFEVPPHVVTTLRELSEEHDVTMFMAGLSAFSLLLHRYTDQNHIGVGTPVANRVRHETESMIGFFANTLVMSADFTEDMSFVELLAQTREIVLQGQAHQLCPFEQLVEDINPERSLSYSPLFQVMFMLQSSSQSYNGGKGFDLESVSVGSKTVSEFDMTLGLVDSGDKLHGSILYCSDLFKPSTIERFREHYLRLMELLCESPERPVSTLDFLSTQERHLEYSSQTESAMKV